MYIVYSFFKFTLNLLKDDFLTSSSNDPSLTVYLKGGGSETFWLFLYIRSRAGGSGRGRNSSYSLGEEIIWKWSNDRNPYTEPYILQVYIIHRTLYTPGIHYKQDPLYSRYTLYTEPYKLQVYTIHRIPYTLGIIQNTQSPIYSRYNTIYTESYIL